MEQNTKPMLDKISEYIAKKIHKPLSHHEHNTYKEMLETNIKTPVPDIEMEEIKHTLNKLRETTNKLDYRDKMLLDAKKEWENTFDSIHEFVVLINPDKTIKRANISFANYINESIQTIIGENFEHYWKLICTDKTVDEILKESQSIIHINDDDKWLKSSLSFIYNEDKTINSYVLVLTDITNERKNLRIMNVIVNDLFESIFRFNNKGIITFANNAFLKTFDICDDSNDLIGKHINNVFKNQEEFLNLLSTNISKLNRSILTTSYIACLKHNIDTDVVLKVNIRVTFNGAPTPLEYLIVTQDITDFCSKCKFYNSSD